MCSGGRKTSPTAERVAAQLLLQAPRKSPSALCPPPSRLVAKEVTQEAPEWMIWRISHETPPFFSFEMNWASIRDSMIPCSFDVWLLRKSPSYKTKCSRWCRGLTYVRCFEYMIRIRVWGVWNGIGMDGKSELIWWMGWGWVVKWRFGDKEWMKFSTCGWKLWRWGWEKGRKSWCCCSCNCLSQVNGIVWCCIKILARIPHVEICTKDSNGFEESWGMMVYDLVILV